MDLALVFQKTETRVIRMNLEDKQALQMLFANEKFDRVCHLAAQAGVRYSIDNPDAYVKRPLHESSQSQL